jgi:hypothetical protein
MTVESGSKPNWTRRPRPFPANTATHGGGEAASDVVKVVKLVALGEPTNACRSRYGQPNILSLRPPSSSRDQARRFDRNHSVCVSRRADRTRSAITGHANSPARIAPPRPSLAANSRSSSTMAHPTTTERPPPPGAMGPGRAGDLATETNVQRGAPANSTGLRRPMGGIHIA